MHAHWIPPALAEALRARRSAPRIEPDGTGGERLVMPVGTLRFDIDYVDLDRRLAFMQESGVERQLLSLPGLFGIDSLPLEEAQPLVRMFNDATSAACQRHSGEFQGLAALPLADAGLACEELRHARRTLGLRGAILPINGFSTLARARALRPLFEVANELGAHLFLHPGRRPDEVGLPAPAVRDQDLARRALDVQTEVAGAMITLLLSDYLDAFPRVSLHVANLGGTFPAIVERIDHTIALRTPDAPLASSRAARVRVDCSSLGPLALAQAVRVYGAERVLFGTDCPIFSTQRTFEAVRHAGLTPDEQQRILRGNALELL